MDSMLAKFLEVLNFHLGERARTSNFAFQIFTVYFSKKKDFSDDRATKQFPKLIIAMPMIRVQEERHRRLCREQAAGR